MEFLSDIAGVFMTVVSGGATGLLGSVVSGLFKWLDRKAEAQQRKADRDHEYRMQELQIKARSAETEQELAIIGAETSREQLTASYKHDSSVGQSYRWVAAVLRLVRPVLTFVLIGLTAWLYHKLGTDAVIDGIAIKGYIVQTIVYTTSAAVLWWFGDRAMQIRK